MKKVCFACVGILLTTVAVHFHHLKQMEDAEKAARQAEFQAAVKRCADSGRYQWVPTYEPDDYLRVYPTGYLSPKWQCMFEIASHD